MPNACTPITVGSHWVVPTLENSSSLPGINNLEGVA